MLSVPRDIIMKLFLSPHHALHATQSYPLAEGGAVLEQPVRIDNIYAGICRVANLKQEEVKDLGASVISRIHPAGYVDFLKTAF